MEYFLILLSALVYGFLGTELFDSFFPSRWQKTGPRVVTVLGCLGYLALLYRLCPGFPAAHLVLNFGLLAAFLLCRRRLLWLLLVICSAGGALAGLFQALALFLGRSLPLPFQGPPGALAACALAGTLPLFIGMVRLQYEREVRARQQLVAVRERSAAREEAFQALTAAYAAQRKLTHDFRHHLAALTSLLESGSPEKVRAYLKELEESQTGRPLLVNCRHPFLDAILNQKGYAAQGAGVDIHFELNDLSGVKIRETHLAVVLGNLLDNALEACQRLPDPSSRWVRVKLIHDREAGVLFLSIENASPFVEVRGDSIPSSKPEPELHGYGLPNVFSVLRQYGADWVMRYQEGAFLTAVEWPEPKS